MFMRQENQSAPSISSGEPVPQQVFQLRLPQLLNQAAQGNRGITYLAADRPIETQPYAALWQAAASVLQGLRQQNLQPSDGVILHCAQSQNLLTGLWSCFLGGFVPAPIAVALDYTTDQSKTLVLRQAIQQFEQPLILTEQALQATVQDFCQRSNFAQARVVAIEPLLSYPAATQLHAGNLEDLALLSFTSGSTGQPKGVMFSQRQLLTAAYGMATANHLTQAAVSLNWMPLEHVASLVMFHLTQVYLGCQQLQVASERILTDPLQWLELIDRYRVTATWAPNFAYGLINDRAETIQSRSWDLSCLRWMGNGAEAVVGKTTRRFLELLMPQGLGATVVSPGYGMSETCGGIVHNHDFSLATTSAEDAFVSVGQPIPGVAIRIVDEANQLLPEGAIGRLQVQGDTVMVGYYQQPELNQQVFTADGWFDTGDLGFLQTGHLTITGRQKEVIIINGVNYYNHEIEAAIETLPGICVSFTAACAVRSAQDTTDRLAIFFVPAVSSALDDPQRVELIRLIRRQVVQAIGIPPSVVIPVTADHIPKTNLGKIQRSQLTQRFQAGEFDHRIEAIEVALRATTAVARPQNQLEHQIATIWQQVLNLPTVGIHDNFFELGGTSLLLMQVLKQLQVQYALSAVTLFQYPTIATLAQYLTQAHHISSQPRAAIRFAKPQLPHQPDSAIAVIGMACRFPGANSIDQFWQNLCDGVESIAFFTAAEILATGVDSHLLQHPDYVKASPILNSNIADFDAEFFGYSPKEASLIDPQQRLLLECAWESLEDAGYDPFSYSGAIGLYAGASMNTYLLNQVYPNRNQLDENDSLQLLTLSSMGGFQLTVANDKDYLTTRVSYKLNLTGPSVNVQTACSTSLVAIHMARQSLLNGECDMALAGGVSVHVPQTVGHLYQEGMILSPDGHCRAFDAQAAGTIFGSGAGLVLLKRLDQAVADGDRIYAVIKGSAIGNDGSQKVGYFAPQAAGQARVTAEALIRAGIDPATIGYVEAHGTGTALGDPIEIAGLTEAFQTAFQQTTAQQQTDLNKVLEKQFCAIGSVKTNVGHLNIASGVVGFIKTALCLYHRQIPPSLHFNTPNPQIDFSNSPFYVNTKLIDWQNDSPRRAGVNSLGIGGTNVHLILEELEPETNRLKETETNCGILTLSAKTKSALQELAAQYRLALSDVQGLGAQSAALTLTDICFTTNVGRHHFEHRLGIAAVSIAELNQKLGDWSDPSESGCCYNQIPAITPPIVFLFTGQGSQYTGMGDELYHSCSVFRAAIDRCEAVLQPALGHSLQTILWKDASLLNQTQYTQPALFAIEYALAQLWIAWGVQPAAVIGHSIGEYVAACIAGVLSLTDALTLVVARGRLMQALPSGRMVSVSLDSQKVARMIPPDQNQVSIAAINSSQQTVISGTDAAIEAIVTKLTEQAIPHHFLQVSHAFHSALMEPMLAEFKQIAQQVNYQLPQLNLISNLTGQIADRSIATADYWCQQIRQPVQFLAGITTLKQAGYQIFLECGAKPVLTQLMQTEFDPPATYLASLHPKQTPWQTLTQSLAQLYCCGLSIDWPTFHIDQSPRRITLPTYPFQRQRHWLDRPTSLTSSPRSPVPSFPHSPHPLLGFNIPSPLADQLFQTQLSTTALSFLQDHRIHQTIVFPASGLLEIAIAAAKSTASVRLEAVTIPQPLILADGAKTVQTIVTASGDFQIYSSENLSEWQLHCSGQMIAANSASPQPIDIALLQKALPHQTNHSQHYQRCEVQGLNYGRSFQAVQQIWWREGAALGQIQLADSIDCSSYHVHPVILDAAFQVIGAALPQAQSETYVPIAIERLDWFDGSWSEAKSFWSWVQINSQNHSSFIADIQLLDATGRFIVQVKGLRIQRFEADRSSHISTDTWQNWLYTVEWQLQNQSQKIPSSWLSQASGLWLIFADRQGVAAQLAAHLRRANQSVQLIFAHQPETKAAKSNSDLDIEAANSIQLQQLLSSFNQPLKGTIDLWNLDCPSVEVTNDPLPASLQSCEHLLNLIQALLHTGEPLPRCWFVTAGAQSVRNKPIVNPDQACVGGMIKAMLWEYPQLAVTQIDLDSQHLNLEPPQIAQLADNLFTDIQTNSPENQIAWRAGDRYVARLIQPQLAAPLTQSTATHRLTFQPGTLDLSWQPLPRQVPAADQVEIEVTATGLNFRDLLIVLGMYPEVVNHLGLECTGKLVAVGADVGHFSVGDQVIAIAPGCFSQYVTVSAALVAHQPKSLQAEAAATIPAAFLTAYYALQEIAQIKAGDSILIHAAAGGVGQAAVQLAQQAGATIFATAAPEKWSFLRSQGIQHLFNSRTLEFAEAIKIATAGKGVDIVLNSLSGDFIPQSLSVLSSAGRFIEIGKSDWSQSIAAIRPDIDYVEVDLMQMTQNQPDRIQTLLNQLLPQFVTGQLQPLPHTVFPAEKTIAAFRYMQQAKHIGKIVITPPQSQHLIHATGSYLVTGGLGGLGLQVAQWLVAKGATHVILIGRHSASPEAQKTIDQLRQSATLEVFQIDVADFQALSSFMQDLRAPLRGLIHSAGVIEDASLLQQTRQHFQTVMAAKVQGAWNLHRLTRSHSLDFFVLFSSAASLIGSAGQTNYAAANAFLDALAHYRQAQQLPGLSLNWGAWSQVGMAAALQQNLNKGLSSIAPEQGLAVLEALLYQSLQSQNSTVNLSQHPSQNHSSPQIGVIPIDWARWSGPHIPFFSQWQDQVQLIESVRSPLLQQLDVASAAERRSLLYQYLAQQIGKILGLDPNAIEPQQGLSELGIDSLTSVELRNMLQKDLDCRLPTTLIFDYPTLATLTHYLLQQLAAPIESVSQPQISSDIAALENLSEAEAEALLLAELDRLTNP